MSLITDVMVSIKELWTRYEEAIRYVFFGGLTVLVSWGSYALFVMLGIDPNISNALSWLCAVLFAFVVNKYWVFMSKDSSARKLATEFVQFFGSRVFTGIIAIVLFPALTYIGVDQSMFGIENMLTRLIVSVVEITLNYVFSKYLVFRKDRPAN